MIKTITRYGHRAVSALALLASIWAIAIYRQADPPRLSHLSGPIARIEIAEPALAELVEEATAQIAFDWPKRLRGWSVEFLPGNSAVAGFTWTAQRRIEVFVRPGDDAKSLARVLAHEIGHAIDVSYNRPSDRAAWLEIRGLDSSTPWWPESRSADFHTGAGDFAECVAYWLLGPGDFRSELGPEPTAPQLDLLSEVLAG